MIPIAVLTPQGVIEAPYTAESLAEAAAKELPGVYTVARTFKGNHALMLDDHLDRLERSARLEGIPAHLDRVALRAVLRDLLHRSGYSDSRYRLAIPRDNPDHIYVSLEPYKPVPPDALEHGVRVTVLHIARENPQAKHTVWAAKRKEVVETFPPGIYEGILLSEEDELLEGTSSNFYGIIGGELRTAEDSRVLSGIARKLVLTVAPPILPVHLKAIRLGEIATMTEAFLTSSGRGIVPIVEIDGQQIGTGEPGQVTRQLRRAYDEWTASHVEPI